MESLAQAIHGAPSVRGSPRANRVVLEEIAVVKALDKASPKLAEAVCTGCVRITSHRAIRMSTHCGWSSGHSRAPHVASPVGRQLGA